MYTSFYNFAVEPFSPNPEEDFCWLGKRWNEHVDVVKRSILEQRGVFLLSGAAGIGKTHFTDLLLNRLLNRAAQGYIVIAKQNKLRFFNEILASFGLGEKVVSKVQFTVLFTSYLHSVQQTNKIALLVVDDAHNMHQELLDEVRQLSNIENNGVKLLNILLVGRSEMLGFFEQAKNKALREKVVVSDSVDLLSLKESGQYIKFRIRAAGGDPEIFSKSAVAAIAEIAKGNISSINRLAHASLIEGARQKTRLLKKENVIRASVGKLHNGSAPAAKEGDKSVHGTYAAQEDISRQLFLERVVQGEQAVASAEPKQISKYLRSLILVAFTVLMAAAAVYYSPDLYRDLPVSDTIEQFDGFEMGKKIIQQAGSEEVNAERTEVNREASVPNSAEKKKEVAEEKKDVRQEEGGSETVIPIRLVAEKKKTYPPAAKAGKKQLGGAINEGQIEQQQESIEIAGVEQGGRNNENLSSAEEQRKIPAILTSTLLLETKPNAGFITAEAKKALLQFIRQLEGFPEAEVLVEGYIASRQNSEENIALSLKRASLVADILIDNGISREKITVRGMGNQKPLASNATSAGRKKNRRVEVSVLKLQ